MLPNSLIPETAKGVWEALLEWQVPRGVSQPLGQSLSSEVWKGYLGHPLEELEKYQLGLNFN